MTGSVPNRLAGFATILAAFAAAAGLLVPGLYRDAPFWAQQARGTDLATLFVAVPLLAIGMWTARRGSPAGRLAAVGGLLYVVYNYAIFAFSVAMNPLTVVHFAIFGLALWSLILGAASLALTDEVEAVTERLNRRLSAGFLIGVAALFGLLWLGQIATAISTGTVPADLARAGLSTNPVYALDLAVFLPLCALAGLGLLRRNRGAAFALPMLVWVPLMGAGVLGGFVFAALAGEEIPTAVAAVIAALSIASALLATGGIGRSASPPVSATRPGAQATRSAHQGG
jgi:hypothetical protein